MTDQKHTKWTVDAENNRATRIGPIHAGDGDLSLSLDEAINVAACVNALAGIDDPEGFMQVAREYLSPADTIGGRSKLKARLMLMNLRKHLKGQTNDR